MKYEGVPVIGQKYKLIKLLEGWEDYGYKIGDEVVINETRELKRDGEVQGNFGDGPCVIVFPDHSDYIELVEDTPQENIQIKVGQKYFINDPLEMGLEENYSHGDIVEIEDVGENGFGWFNRDCYIIPHWIKQGYAQLVEDVNQKDLVNSPSHYMLLPGVEVKDVRRAILDNAPKGIPYTQIDDWSRAWEYLTRMWGKNGLEDAKKAQVYLGWLIENMEKQDDE